MKAEKQAILVILAIISLLGLVLPLSACGKSFPYQGSFNGNWTGQLTILSRSVPVGGTITVKIDSSGVGSGTVSTSGGSTAPAKMTAQVDANGNLTGSVSFVISGTAFDSDWTGKITSSGKVLNMQGDWTSQHGKGTFSGTGSK